MASSVEPLKKELSSTAELSPGVLEGFNHTISCKGAGWDYDFAPPGFDKRGLGYWSAGVVCGYDWSDPLHNLFAKDPCSLIVDVGGNIGLSVMPAASKGWRVLTFEPIPQNVEQLNLQKFVNGWQSDRVGLVAAAASNSTGHTKIYVPRGREDNAAMGSAETADRNVHTGSVEGIDIRTITVDDYFAAAHPDLIKETRLVKVDVQGHELSVLQGMRKMLAGTNRNFAVIVELDHGLQQESGHDPADVPNFMESLGWKAYCLHQDGLVNYTVHGCYDVVFKVA